MTPDLDRCSDEELVAAVVEGNPAALRALIGRVGGAVYALCRRICPVAAEAEDLTQEVFLELWSRAGAFDPGRASARAWVMTIARSRAIDRTRALAAAARRETQAQPALEDPRTPADAYDRGQQSRRLAQAIARLPLPQQEAIGLTYYQGLTLEESARSLGCPVGTVKTRVRLALRRLPGLLGPEGLALAP